MLRAHTFAAVLVVSTLGAASPASAAEWIIEKNATHKNNTFDMVGVLSPWLVGAGVNYAIPLVQDGFIPTLNDQFDLELSGYLVYWYWGKTDSLALLPLAGVRWQFHLTPEWSVFALAKSGIRLDFDGGDVSFGHEFGVGGYWHFSKGMSLRMETSSLGLFTVGLGWDV
jgi:hypothetical protein